MRSENASPLVYIICTEKVNLQLCKVFENASVAWNPTALYLVYDEPLSFPVAESRFVIIL
jgi:hypothetical protein